MFLPSPRNSMEAFTSLLDSCKATKFITTAKPMPMVANILSNRSEMQKHIIPELEVLLDATPVTPVPYGKTWAEARLDPFVQIHTSGSTGIPKLMTIKHGNFCCIDAFQALEANELAQRCGDLRLFCNFPPFHVAGLIYILAVACWVDSTVVLPPVGPMTADVVNDCHVYGNVEFSSIPPSLVVDLAKNEDYLENLSRLRGLNYAGGPLPEDTGSLIAQRTKLTTNIGATEYQTVPLLPKEVEDWPYFKFNEKGVGMEFRERDEGLFEMVFVRRPELDLVQAIFITFPELQEYNTKDLFRKHPSKPGLWKYVSRLDDIIVLSNGEKLNPVTMESLITTSPDVKGCVIVGQGRFQAACLIEPSDENVDREQLLERVWPYLQRANQQTVKHGRIVRELVCFTDRDRPLPRAGKGTIQRAAANKLYAAEIADAYRSIDSGSTTFRSGLIQLDLHDVQSTKSSLCKFLQDVLEDDDLAYDNDFFSQGMDSLQLINLLRAINDARPDEPIEAKQIYDHPTIASLASALHAGAAVHHYEDWESDDEAQKEAWLAMDEMYNEYVAEVGRPKRTPKEIFQSSNSGPVFQPDGGTVAWLQVLASFLINVNNWGLVNAFGVFQAYYETDLLRHYSSSSIAIIGTLQGALLLIVGSISGPLFDGGYFQFLLITSSIGLVFAIMMLSLSTQYYQIMLSQGVLMGLCSGFLYIPSVALIPVYFKRHRGLALGIATGGGSIGGIIYPIVFRRLLSSLSFPWATRVIGFIALVTLSLATLLTKPLGPRTRRQLIDLSAIKDIPYLFMMLHAFLIYAAILVPFFLAPTFSTSALHTSDDAAFYTLPILNAAQFLGRLIPAWYTDTHPHYLGPEVLLALAELLAGVLGFCWIAVHNLGGFIPWSIVYGFVSGMVATLPASVLPFVLDNMAIYGTRLGMLYACAGVGLLISTPVAAAADGGEGRFLGAQIWTGAVCLGSVGFFGVCGVKAWRRRGLYEGRGIRGGGKGRVTDRRRVEGV